MGGRATIEVFYHSSHDPWVSLRKALLLGLLTKLADYVLKKKRRISVSSNVIGLF